MKIFKKIISVTLIIFFVLIFILGTNLYLKEHKAKKQISKLAMEFEFVAKFKPYKITPEGKMDYGGYLEEIRKTRDEILEESNCSVENKWGVKLKNKEEGLQINTPTKVHCLLL